jgi:2',3'-cyclic-nucleotide 2'-phosphodiesterase (5'-nucleotidase family)
MRIAVVGAILESLAANTTLQMLGPYHAAPIVATLRPIVAEAKQRADMVIVLGHIDKAEAQEILRGLPDVSVVAIGHEHTPWKDAEEIDGRFIIHAAGYGRQVGRMVLSFDTAARRIVAHQWTGIAVDDSVYPADPAVAAEVGKWEARVSSIVDVPIGRSARELSRVEVKALMEQAMLDTVKADVAFTNLGGVRDTLPQGQLLARHIWNVMPFNNRVVTVDVPGEELAALTDPSGRLRPIVKTPTDARRTYRVATTDFVAQSWADQGHAFPRMDQGLLLRDVIINWVKQRKVIR